VTDYENLGTPGDPTYVIKDAEAHAVLDLARAASHLSRTDVKADSPVGLWGYSQGGQASAAAAEIEATYAPELDVVGAVAGGVPSNLAQMTGWLNQPPGNDYFAVLTFAALGLDAAYPELDLDAYLNADGKALLDAVHSSDTICLFDALTLLKGKTIEDYTTTNPLETVPAWQQRVAQQQLGTKAPEVPVFQFHGNIDQLVPLTQGTTLRDAWCAAGADVTFKDYPTDHFGGLVAGNTDGVAFMTARFAGTASTPGC
jgi:dienelactone hydrolase